MNQMMLKSQLNQKNLRELSYLVNLSYLKSQKNLKKHFVLKHPKCL
jgi:hypothetical protein